MKKYRLAVFDVDGTLLDTNEGVISAVKYTIVETGLKMPDPVQLRSFIGPPIQNSFASLYGLSEDEAQRLADIFRKRYSETDVYKAVPYDNIYNTFDALRKNGIIIAIATYKREDYAVRLLRHFGFDRYTDIMYGGDNDNKLKKSDIIRKCIIESKTSTDETVMVGDTPHDASGAEAVGIDFIGVTYGYGFRTDSDFSGIVNVGIAGSADSIVPLILKNNY